jgi:hypothetical protein
MEKAISLLLITIMLAGCRTTSMVNINTNVPDATVVVDGKVIGNTPIHQVKMKNSSGRTYLVIIEKEGYETYRGVLSTETKTANTTAVVVGYVLSFLILPMLLWVNGLWISGPQEDQYFVLKEDAP